VEWTKKLIGKKIRKHIVEKVKSNFEKKTSGNTEVNDD
jgi:hypothetical protein